MLTVFASSNCSTICLLCLPVQEREYTALNRPQGVDRTAKASEHAHVCTLAYVDAPIQDADPDNDPELISPYGEKDWKANELVAPMVRAVTHVPDCCTIQRVRAELPVELVPIPDTGHRD